LDDVAMTDVASAVVYPRIRIVILCGVALATWTARPAVAFGHLEGIPVPQAKNACALVTAADVQPLAGRIADGKPEPPDPLGSLARRYEWGAVRAAGAQGSADAADSGAGREEEVL
jgi:hypothetical protein